MGAGSSYAIYYGEESSYATVPAIQFQEIKKGSPSFAMTPETEQSSSWTAGTGRTPVQTVILDRAATIGFDIPTFYGGPDEFWAAGLGNDWQGTALAQNIAYTVTDNADGTFDLDNGGSFDWLAFLGGGVNTRAWLYIDGTGLFRVDPGHTTPTSQVVTCQDFGQTQPTSGTFNVVNSGTAPTASQRRSFHIEEAIVDDTTYWGWRGMMVDTMALDLTGGPFTTSFGLVGPGIDVTQNPTYDTSSQSTGAVLAAPTTGEFSSRTHTRWIIEGASGGVVVPYCVTQMTIDVANNLAQSDCLNLETRAQHDFGSPQVSGTFVAEFDTNSRDVVDRFFRDQFLSIYSFHPGPDGGSYLISMGNVRYTGGGTQVQDQNSKVLVNMQFEVLEEASSGSFFQLDRFSGIHRGNLNIL